MYDWVKIARAILSSWSEQYVRWLRERFGPVDAVKILGPGASHVADNYAGRVGKEAF